MSAVKIFGKFGDRFKMDSNSLTRIIGKAQGNYIAIYSVVGGANARNDVFIDHFCHYFSKSPHWSTSDLSYIWTIIEDELSEETAGIWMSPTPFNKQLANGTTVSIYLLNSRLCSRGESVLQDNALVLTLTTLLSSVMIMNINDAFDDELFHFLRHPTAFARYELNGDQPFQKLIFFYQDWEEKDNPDWCHGFHSDTHPECDGQNFKRGFFNPFPYQDIKERSVRQSMASTFKQITVCLSNSCLGSIKLQFDEELGCYPLDSYYPLSVIRSICDSDAITIKSIDGRPTRGPTLLSKLNEWKAVLESYTIPQKVSSAALIHSFSNQIAVNSALDYYYYKMNDYFTEEEVIDFRDYQINVAKESVELFQSFQLFGGKAFEKRTIRSFERNLKETHIWLKSIFNSNSGPNQRPSLHEILGKYEKVNDLEDKFKDMKTESDTMRKEFDEKLADALGEVMDIKSDLAEFKEFLQKKAKTQNVEGIVDGIASVVGDIVPASRPLMRLAKVVYNSTMK